MTAKKKSKGFLDGFFSKSEKIERIIANIICILTFCSFAFVSLYSIFQTSVINPDKYSSEVILYKEDNVILNIIVVALFLLLLYKLGDAYDFFSKISLFACEIAVFVIPLTLGVIWVLSVKTIPAADSMNVFESAVGAVKGDYTAFQSNNLFYNHDFYSNNSYYFFYPFQLGIVFISELLYHIFGTETAIPLEILNVFCCAMSYLAIAKISRLVFKRRSVEFITILLLIGCFQPVFFTAFPYGNIIGMCCAVWAAYFLIRYFQEGKYLLFIPIGVLLTVAVLAKYNNMIYLIAFAITLIVHAIRKKKWQSLAVVLALVILCTGVSKLIIFSYEQRSKTEFKDGVSQTLYLDMGLNESWMAPGWYTKLGLETYLNSNFDSAAANKTAKADIGKRLDKFFSDPAYAYDFFSKKIVSQWNEPTYESIWVSKVKSHYEEIGSFATSVYDKSWGQFFDLYFNEYMQLVFVMFSGGILMLFIRKKTNIETILLPLVLLGGFTYHLLFEGKSQYVLTYIILLLPYAAYFAISLPEIRLKEKLKKSSQLAAKQDAAD